MRQLIRMRERTAVNAALCGLPVAEYLALGSRERKRRARRARLLARSDCG